MKFTICPPSQWRNSPLSWCALDESSYPRCTRGLRRQDHDIARNLARSIAKCNRFIELHRQAVVFRETIWHIADRHLHPPFLHPDLLMDTHLTSAGFISHARASRQIDLDDLDWRGKVGR